MTKAELIALCKSENQKMFSEINGEQIELVGQDYEAACQAWAEMRMEQIAYEAKQEVLKQAEAQAKANAEAKLAALGLTADDLRVLGL